MTTNLLIDGPDSPIVMSAPAGPAPMQVIHPYRLRPRTILSPREIQLLSYLSYGLTTYDIAAILSLSEETIGTHRRNIMRKLDVCNIVHAVAFCIRNKIIE